MPEMSGMEAVGKARTVGNKTFVTLMSANANQRRLQLAQQLRVYEFLAKPFTTEQVMEILKTYCRVTVPSNALVVDDSATVRRIIKKVFANSIFNIDITEAGDGQTALDHCENGEFDVVFLDCDMPGLPGTATLERLLEPRREGDHDLGRAQRDAAALGARSRRGGFPLQAVQRNRRRSRAARTVRPTDAAARRHRADEVRPHAPDPERAGRDAVVRVHA
jgi:CheY-like chemotaxis protein